MMSFDFERDVWANLRLRIRTLGSGSIFYRFLEGLLKILEDRAAKANEVYKNIWFETAEGYGVILWGQRYGIHKIPGESDEDFKIRVQQERAQYRSPTDATRRVVLAGLFGLNTEQIRIEKAYKGCFGCGAPVGSIVGTRDYMFHAFRIYLDLSDPDAGKVEKALKLLERLNIGGNYPELWFDKGVADAPSTSTAQGRPIWENPATPAHDYEVH